MMRRNNAESGSTKKEKETFSLPDNIQSNKLTVIECDSNDRTCIKTKRERTNAPSTLPQAINPTSPFDIFLPKSPVTRNPISGNKGINAINFIINILTISF